MSKWSHPIPVWVSRKNADGQIAQFTVSLWMFMTLAIGILLNALLWIGIGLYAAVQVILGAF
jgi:hypothetical protein